VTRYKIVPEPADEELLVAARGALPLVPGSVEDCCTRVRNRTEVTSRDAAREWLTFLQALDLAAETPRGFHRTHRDPDRGDLGDAFLETVFGAREIHDALATAEEPLRPGAAFERVRGIVPRWERDRRADWESEWQRRVTVLLEWGVVLGVVAERNGRYTPKS
jgi:hypothetical protein